MQSSDLIYCCFVTTLSLSIQQTNLFLLQIPLFLHAACVGREVSAPFYAIWSVKKHVSGWYCAITTDPTRIARAEYAYHIVL